MTRGDVRNVVRYVARARMEAWRFGGTKNDTWVAEKMLIRVLCGMLKA